MQKILNCSEQMFIEFLLKCTENLKTTTKVVKWLNFTLVIEVLRSCFWQLLLQGHSKRVVTLKNVPAEQGKEKLKTKSH